MRDYLNIIGIMTGNSLDGADLVLTRFSLNGEIKDLIAHSIKNPVHLAESLRFLRKVVNDHQGDMPKVVSELQKQKSHYGDFDAIEDAYTKLLVEAVEQLISKAQSIGITRGEIDLIGSHGQTCAHYPPSIAKNSNNQNSQDVYTVQIGDAQKLANLTGITVVADFRSDDLMNGGEGAPLAPIHHRHLAQFTKMQGNFPIAFCNAGNTGNISVITQTVAEGVATVIGFDTGPFNDFPDKLMQQEKGQACDRDGLVGKTGKVQLSLLRLLFEKAVLTKDGANFLLKPPPRSSDPEWYILIDEVKGKATVDGTVISFADRLRTAEYFSAYIYFYGLLHINSSLVMPRHFALSGGGWRNPLIKEHFYNLLNGNFRDSPLLAEHEAQLTDLYKRISENSRQQVFCKNSEEYGFDGTAMEARIFADAAKSRICGEPFTAPETTGVSKPVVAGVIRFKNDDSKNATVTVQDYLNKFQSQRLTVDNTKIFDPRWNRAVAGWRMLLSSTAQCVKI